jgi:hypothetical protein
MVPTFCVEQEPDKFPLIGAPVATPLAFGKARFGNGDLPLVGEGGGEPKRES